MKTKGSEFFYEQFASEFDSKMNMYDTLRRVYLIFNEILDGVDLKGKKILDAGSGTGWFSKKAFERGAEVTALDVGEKLLAKVKEKCNVRTVVGDILKLDFETDSFDFVICSEVIEHTLNPRQAVKEIVRVTKKSGTIVLTTPNKLWYFSVWIANKLNLRPYKGIEDWVAYYKLRKWFVEENCEVLEQRGFHIAPLLFMPLFHPLLEFMDKFGDFLGPVMLNTAIKCKKIANG
jgi:2-polyprenyl-3-methyl-5-hydroxy-6-metoxy-1,4-benzoquinol methylase